MRAVTRASVVLAVAAATTLAIVPAANAKPVACQYTKAKKLVTLSIENVEPTGSLTIERELGSTRIGFEVEGQGWKRCGVARTTNTDKVKVVGSTLSERITLSLANGPFAPGATQERSGASEIEFVANLGAGTDSLTLVGGDGDNSLGFSKPGQATLNGDDDVDVEVSGLDRWYLEGGAGNDRLDGHGTPKVEIRGGEGADRLIGGPGSDKLYGDDDGEPGRDDVLVGGGGHDDLYGYLGNDTLLGGDGDDWMVGYEGRDVARGGPGDDAMDSMTSKDGADLLDGGPGSDWVYYYNRSVGVKVSLDNRANDGAKGEGDDVRSTVESVKGGSGNDTLVGSAVTNDLSGGTGNDVLKGLAGDDNLNGYDGDDSLFGGAGDEWFGNQDGHDRFFGEAGDDSIQAGSFNDGRDVFSGGPGVDSISYDPRSNPVTIDPTVAGDDGEAGENDDVRDDFEYLYGGWGSDLIVGTNADNYLTGGSGLGADTLRGRGGSDRIYGNDGDDTIVGGEGYDELYGGGNDDTIDSADLGEDEVDCGADSDQLTAWDALLDSAFNCEAVPPL